MFGIGGSEILVILIVALLFLGPDKLPEAAKSISKGIRDLKKQSRLLQQQIEDDERIGGAIRDIKSALRGDEAPPVRPKKKALAPPANTIKAPDDAALAKAELHDGLEPPKPAADAAEASSAPAPPAEPAVKLPPTAGDQDPDAPDDPDHARELAKMIRPASGTIAHVSESETKPEREHG